MHTRMYGSGTGQVASHVHTRVYSSVAGQVAAQVHTRRGAAQVPTRVYLRRDGTERGPIEEVWFVVTRTRKVVPCWDRTRHRYACLVCPRSFTHHCFGYTFLDTSDLHEEMDPLHEMTEWLMGDTLPDDTLPDLFVSHLYSEIFQCPVPYPFCMYTNPAR